MAGSEGPPDILVVADAGPLIHLDELAVLDLLHDFRRVLVPEAVWEEVEGHRPEALRALSDVLQRVTVATQDAALLSVSQVYMLHAGEREALALCSQHPRSMLLSDDTAARLAAVNLNVSVHGTVGVLVRAIRRGTRSRAEVIELLKAIPARSSLHIKPALLDAVIGEVAKG
ncbi:MAG: DNA-binding protein [Betaproteobacteria bacterium]|nr:DNA-binding protein [Betaproteobacteria bacterium]